jgi:DnaJ-class molecular chaperone
MREQFQVIGVLHDAEGGAAYAAACLADEVAIDFPSIVAALDRMRRSFLDSEASARHSTEIRLTPREAFFGADVPIDVPVSATCGACGGRGEVWMDPCATCGGTGSSVAHHHVRLTVPAGVRDGARFRFSIAPPSAPATAVEVRIAVR